MLSEKTFLDFVSQVCLYSNPKVYFNEPISMLQKVTEVMEYPEVMERGVLEECSLMRLAYVNAFYTSPHGVTMNRLGKPFNPVLGETFEMMTKRYKMIVEQVSHHPPISAMHVKGRGYEMWMNSFLKSTFKGTHLDFIPLGRLHLTTDKWNDHFVLQRPKTAV